MSKVKDSMFFVIEVPYEQGAKFNDYLKVQPHEGYLEFRSVTSYTHDPRKFPPGSGDNAFSLEDKGQPPGFVYFSQIEDGQMFRYGKNVYMRSNDALGVCMGTGKKMNFNDGTPVIPVKSTLIIEDLDGDEG